MKKKELEEFKEQIIKQIEVSIGARAALWRQYWRTGFLDRDKIQTLNQQISLLRDYLPD